MTGCNQSCGPLFVNDATNASPIVIATSAVCNFATGDLVDISNVQGNVAANGNWLSYGTQHYDFFFLLDGSDGTGSGFIPAPTDYAQKAIASTITAVDTNPHHDHAQTGGPPAARKCKTALTDEVSIGSCLLNGRPWQAPRAGSTTVSSRSAIFKIHSPRSPSRPQRRRDSDCQRHFITLPGGPRLRSPT